MPGCMQAMSSDNRGGWAFQRDGRMCTQAWFDKERRVRLDISGFGEGDKCLWRINWDGSGFRRCGAACRKRYIAAAIGLECERPSS